MENFFDIFKVILPLNLPINVVTFFLNVLKALVVDRGTIYN
jgi:hypothetical protein